MKYIKLFAALLITLLVGAFTATAGYCDAVDDVCSEFGWSYRWTVDVELDDTYDGTWLDQISDDGKLRLSYIMLENTMQTKNADGGTEYIYSLFVAEGEWSVMVTSLDGAASIEKSGSDYLLLSSDNKQSALYNLTRDVDMSEEKSFGLVGCYGYQNDANKRFAVILDYTDTPTLTPDFYASRYTPILISYDVLKEAEDTKADYNSRRTYMRYTQKSALPVVTYLNATAVVREDKKEMFVATPTVEEKVNIKEDAEEVLLEYGIDADYIDRFAHESRRIKSYSLTTARRTPDGVYEIMPMMGRVGKQFYAHVPIGKMEFTVTVDRSRPQADITDDGKLKVTVQMYMRYHAYCGDAVQYGIYTDGPVLLVKYEGNRGVQYGYDLLKLNRKTASTMMVRYGKYSTVKEYDDELIVIQRLNGSGDDENLYDCPNLYFEFD